MRAYNEGRSSKYLYSRYANPTVHAVEQKIAALEGAESALVLSSGQAATTTALMALLRAGDEVVCSAAIYGGTLHLLGDLLREVRHHARGSSSLEELARPDRLFSDGDEAGVVRVADQPDAALRRHRRGGGRVPGARGRLGDRQHVRQPDQPAAARARRRPRRCRARRNT